VAVAPGTAVTLVASPAGGSTFAGWTGGGCAGTGPCTTTARGATTVTATFAPARHALRVAVVGSGAVTATPGELACADGVCTASYGTGASVTLAATPAAGHVFAGWSGADCAGSAPCVVTMDGARAATATFVPSFALTVGSVGNGSGRVTSTPAGIDCARASGAQRGACGGAYAAGTTVTLTAAPGDGTNFTGWSGAGCGGAGPCVVTMSEARAVTANFWRATASLAVTTAGPGSGTVSSSPAGIACARSAGAQSGACGAEFAGGSAVTLTAAPAAGSTFTGWTGACSGTGACVVPLDGAATIGATFGVAQEPLTVTFAGTGPGTITSSPAGIACTRAVNGTVSGTCTASFDRGTPVTLSAVRPVGSWFLGWSGACSGISVCVVSMSGAQSTSAFFLADPNPPTVGVSGVVNGGVYAVFPTIMLSATDDFGLATPFIWRVSWHVQRPDGTQLCHQGSGFFSASTGTCPAVGVGTPQLASGGPAGVHTLTVWSTDMVGNVSTPITLSFTTTN
ncbi:hypothetical protein PYV61_24855, partial [Roseisolibacter sp. H3M3-2]